MKDIAEVAIIGEGRGSLSFHAVRNDGTAACSSYIPVRIQYGMRASEVSKDGRCRSRACQKMFNAADARAAAPVAPEREVGDA